MNLQKILVFTNPNIKIFLTHVQTLSSIILITSHGFTAKQIVSQILSQAITTHKPFFSIIILVIISHDTQRIRE